MVFSSTIFLFLFLPIVLGMYYVLNTQYRNTFLLLVSLAFYAWGEPKFIIIMLVSIAINYIFGLAIGYTEKNTRKVMLVAGVVVNCSILFYFKYFNFFIENVNKIGNTNISLKEIILPIGISFFTFQGMSYILDVFMGTAKVQKNFINIALYVSLFPQLIAGPIVRYKDVNDQIDDRVCNQERFAEGISRFIIGLGKKTIISNNVGFIADSIFNLPYYQNSQASAWLGIICYALQVYFDFSGYSDMAIGLGKMFGFEFLENFNYPYISKSVTEFWRRWHISLSTWFRDYIYIPLGGNRRGNVYVNLLIVFMVTGLWHGAAWNFIIWGLWHGMFLIIERIVKKKNINFNFPSYIKWFYTMIVVLIGWVLFRSVDLTYALNYLGIMFGVKKSYDVGFSVWYYLNPMVITVMILGVIGSIPVKEIVLKSFQNLKLNNMIILLSYNVYVIVVFLISIIFVITSTYNPFIYFRF